VRRGTRQSGYLHFPDHTFLAFFFELSALSLSLALCLGLKDQHTLSLFLYVTPLITSLLVTLSCANSFLVYYHRIWSRPYRKGTYDITNSVDSDDELSEAHMQREQEEKELDKMLEMIGDDDNELLQTDEKLLFNDDPQI
jgi:hypothetical protein